MGWLAQPRLRLEKAKAHRARIAKLWNGFIEGDDPYTTLVHVDDDGWGAIEVYPDEAIPLDEISLESGELLYQLRAALDSLVYELAIIDTGQDPPPDAEKLEFPIRSSQANFEEVAWKIAPLSERHRMMVNSLQPYPAPNQTDAMKIMAETLNVLHDWARKDRHRGLHAVASWATEKNPCSNPPKDAQFTPSSSPRMDLSNRTAKSLRFGWPGSARVAGPCSLGAGSPGGSRASRTRRGRALRRTPCPLRPFRDGTRLRAAAPRRSRDSLSDSVTCTGDVPRWSASSAA